MLTFKGYVPVRRGLIEHVRSGRLTVTEYVVFTFLLVWADHRTGIATINGPGIVGLSGGQLDLDYVQKCVASLERKGYIKRPFFVQGQRGDQKIFIDKFVVTRRTENATEVKVLSFADTTDWENPAYVDLTEDPRGNAGGNAASNENREPKHVKPGNDSVSDLGPSSSSEQVDDSWVPGDGEKEQRQVQNLHSSSDRLSESNTKSKTNGNPKHDAPSSASPRTVVDKYKLLDEWRKLIREVELPDSAIDLLNPGQADFLGILQDVPDSVDHIIAVVRWGVETSNHWFKKPKGLIRNSTELRNAYPEMARQYIKYKSKGASAS